ncbi:MAG: hypothetical protein ACREH4_08970 [Vitreimonas sp.]
MRIPISVAILGVVGLVGAGAFGVWKLRDLRPPPSPEMAMAREMAGQWRPSGLTCADGVTIDYQSGNLTVDHAGQSEDDMQAVAGLEPNGFIRTYSAQLGSRFYLVEGDTLTMRSADGQTAQFERCDADAPAVTPIVASAQDTAPQPLPLQPTVAQTAVPTQSAPPPASPSPPAQAAATVADNAVREEAPAPAPALTLLAAAPAAPPAPEPVAAPPLPPITQPVWLARPTGAEIAIFYPERALVRELPGRASLDCLVRPDGRLNCSVQAESPAGYGFGEAALGVAQSFRMAQSLADGSATEGRRVSVSVGFTQN